MSNLEPIDLQFIINSKEFQAEMERIRLSVRRTTDSAKKDVDSLQAQFDKLEKLAAGIFTANAAKDFVMQMIAVRSELKDTETSFKVFLGSAERASEFMEELSRHAYNSVFEFKDIAKGAASLLSYGAAADGVVPILEKLSNIAAGTNQPLQTMIELYNKAATSTNLAKQDLEQMQRNGIPIVRQLAEAYNKTQQEIWDMASAGKIGFADMQLALDGLTTVGGMFFNMMEEKSKNISDRIGLLQDSITAMFNDLGMDNEQLLRNGIDAAIVLVENYNEIIKVLKVLAISYGIYRAALIANTLAVSGMSAVELLHYGRLVIVEKAQRLLNITTAANPYVAAAAALAILATALYVFADRTTAAEKAQSRLNDIIQQANMSVVEETVKLNDLIRVAKDENKTKAEREKAIADINKISPEYLGNLTLENLKTKEGIDLINAYVDALKRKAFEEAAYNERVAIERERLELRNGKDATGFFGDTFASMMQMSGNIGIAARIRGQARKDAKELLDEREKALDDEIKNRESKQGSTDPTTDSIVKNKKHFQSIIDENTAKLNALDRSAADFVLRAAPLKKAIADAQKALKAYEVGNANAAATRSENLLKKLLEDLEAAERSALRSGMIQEESKLDEINARYDQLGKRAKALGVNPAVLARIEQARKFESGNEKQKQEVEGYKKQLDQQAQLHKEYEDYRQRIGEERAQQMYAGQMAAFDGYIAYINSELEKIEGDESISAQLIRNILADQLVATENENRKKKNDYFVSVLEAYETYEQQRQRIISESERAINELTSKGETERADEARKQRDEELSELTKTRILATDEFMKLSDDFEDMSVATAREAIKNARKLFEEYITGSDRTQEEIAQLRKFFDRFFDDMDEAANDKLSASFDDAAASVGRFTQSFGDIDDGLAKNLQSVTNLIGGMVDLRRAIIDIKRAQENGNTLQGISSFVSGFGSLISMFGSLYSMIASSSQEQWEHQQSIEQKQLEARNKALEYQLSLLNELYGTERLNKYREAIAQLDQQEKELRQSLAGRVQYTGDKRIDGYIDQFNSGQRTLADLERLERVYQQRFDQNPSNGAFLGQLVEIQRAIKAIRESAKLTGDETLEELLKIGNLDQSTIDKINELKEKTEQYKEVIGQLKAELTGTSVSGLADEIDTMLGSLERRTETFGDNFEKIMQRALRNSFKQRLMEEQLQPWFESLYNMMDGSNGMPSESEIAALRDRYIAIGENASELWDKIEKATGISLGDDNAKGMSGRIQSITMEQADVLSGQVMGIHFAVIRGYELNKQQLDAITASMDYVRQLVHLQHDIANNTGVTAQNTKRLEKIEYYLEKISKGNNNSMRAGGN